MVNYKVVNDTIVEQTTGQVVKEGLLSHDAKALCRHLNFGGGFDGFTPAFFLEKPKFLYYDEESFYK